MSIMCQGNCFYLSRVLWGLLCRVTSFYACIILFEFVIERPSLRQLIWWNLSYQVAHMIWFQFLLNIIVHSAMAVLTIMTDSTAMSRCDMGGCTQFPFCYWLLLFVHCTNHWFCKNSYFCKDSLLNRLSLQTRPFLQSIGVSTISL